MGWQDDPISGDAKPSAKPETGNGGSWKSDPVASVSGKNELVSSKEPTFIDNATAPLKEIVPDIKHEFMEGQKEAGAGVRDIYQKAKAGKPNPQIYGDLASSITGGLQMIGSPGIGAVKALVGDPSRKLIPQDTMAGRMTSNAIEDAAGMVLPAKLGQGVSSTIKAGKEGLSALKGAINPATGIVKELTAEEKASKFAKESADKLMKEGVELTPGQIKPMIKSTEGKMTSFPIVGGAIQSALRRSTETWNVAMGNRVLKPLGMSLPKDVTPGYEMIDAMNDKINQAYKEIHPQIQFSPDPEFEQSLKATIAEHAPFLQQNEREQLGSILKTVMRDALYKEGPPSTGFMGMTKTSGQAKPLTIDGEKLQNIRSRLREEARQLGRDSNVGVRRIGRALNDVNMDIGEAIQRMVPKEVSEKLSKADNAYAQLVRFEEAAANRVKSGGIFSVNDFGSAIKRQEGGVRNKTFARGDAMMQDWHKEAQSVIPHDYADSGTAGREQVAHVARDLAAGGLGYALSPYTLVPPVAGAALYSRPGIKAINDIAINGLPTTGPIAEGIKKISPMAAQGYYGLNPVADIVSTIPNGKKQ